MATRISSPNWLLALSLYLVALFLNRVILLGGAGRVTSNSVLSPYSPSNGPQDALLQRRLLMGREVIPPMSPNNNAIPGEPSCDELRAMWRYYKRQSRAEYTNEIPRFGSNMFWDILPPPQSPRISSFVPIKGRNKARLKLKNAAKSPAYGRMVYKQERERQRNKQQQPPSPMEQVSQLMGKGTEGKERGGPIPDAIIHLSPPITPVPTTPTSFQQIKEVFREERIRDKAAPVQESAAPQPPQQNMENGKTFGRIILGPPRGMDGRVANKPREFMTPFEKIRFGHADDLLEDGSKPNMNLMAKRRTLPLHHSSMYNRQARFGSVMVEDEGDSSGAWIDGGLEQMNRFEVGGGGGGGGGGGSVTDANFGMDGGSWGSFPLRSDEGLLNDYSGGMLVEMQQHPQQFQNLKTLYSRPIPELPPQVRFHFFILLKQIPA